MRQTFLVDVVQTQNATWQGTVKWVNEGKEHHFRSALELIRLLDSALETLPPEEGSEEE